MMRFILFFSIVLFCSKNGFSQISVKEDMERDSVVWRPFGVSIPELKCYYGGDKGTYYIYFYQNPEYTHITDIHSIYLGDKKQTLDFFNMLMDMKGTGKEYDLKISFQELHIKENYIGSSKGYISIYDKKDRVFTYFNYMWLKKILKVLN